MRRVSPIIRPSKKIKKSQGYKRRYIALFQSQDFLALSFEREGIIINFDDSPEEVADTFQDYSSSVKTTPVIVIDSFSSSDTPESEEAIDSSQLEEIDIDLQEETSEKIIEVPKEELKEVISEDSVSLLEEEPAEPLDKLSREEPPELPKEEIEIEDDQLFEVVPEEIMIEPEEIEEIKKPWWESIFTENFLNTIPEYSQAYIRREVNFIESGLGLNPGWLVLDIGCGTGRHAIELANRGYQVVGIDLSLPLLTRAAEEAQQRNVKVTFLHKNILETEFEQGFDGIYCIGTSFGYFDEGENIELIKKIYQILKPNSYLLLEVINRDYVIKNQPNFIWFEGKNCVIREETSFNYITSRLLVRRNIFYQDKSEERMEYNIRLYSCHELGMLLHENGFRVTEISGDFVTPGAFFGSESKRLIIVSEKRAP
jgi:SAM-dependent methyltransferase